MGYATARTGGGTDRDETAAVASFRPHIVMAIAEDPEIVAILDAIERRLEASAPRPLHWGWTPRTALVAFIGADDERRTRAYSYAPGMPARPEQRERRNATAADFAREFPDVSVARVFNGYGVPYQIMYAAAAAGALHQRRLTGADLARGIGITQTPGTRQVHIGRRDLAAGFADAALGPIALQNLLPGYPLNWSQNSSGAPMVDNGRIYCSRGIRAQARWSRRPPGRCGKEKRMRSPGRLCRAHRTTGGHAKGSSMLASPTGESPRRENGNCVRTV